MLPPTSKAFSLSTTRCWLIAYKGTCTCQKQPELVLVMLLRSRMHWHNVRVEHPSILNVFSMWTAKEWLHSALLLANVEWLLVNAFGDIAVSMHSILSCLARSDKPLKSRGKKDEKWSFCCTSQHQQSMNLQWLESFHEGNAIGTEKQKTEAVPACSHYL